eukprot:s8362_g1.t1
MAKVKERKRGDSVSAAGTPAQGTPGEKKEEKKPVAKKMPEDIKKKQQMMKEYGEKQELLKKKLEEAKASAESIGRQRPSEPEGEPRKKMTAEKISQKESEDDERNLENVDKKWLKKQYSDRGCFWCKQPGHRAEECKLMWQKGVISTAQRMVSAPTELASRSVAVRTSKTSVASARVSSTRHSATAPPGPLVARNSAFCMLIAASLLPQDEALRQGSPDKGGGAPRDAGVEPTPRALSLSQKHPAVSKRTDDSGPDDSDGEEPRGPHRRQLSEKQYEALVRCAQQVVALSGAGSGSLLTAPAR